MSNFGSRVKMTLRAYWQAKISDSRQRSRRKLLDTQNRKLRAVINFAARNIKYYREIFKEANVKPEDIQCQRDLSKLPILTKDQLRDRFWDFLPRELPSCRVSRTSGSTGVPVCILSDENSRLFNSAAVIRYRKAVGIPLLGQSILTPLKSIYDLSRKPHWTFLQGLHKTFYVNPYAESTENFGLASATLKQLNKHALIGITPAIRKLAYCIRDGSLPSIRPTVVLTVGEVLTGQVREILESTFHSPVVDIYACNEAGDVAWQCLKNKYYHINIDNVIVEVLDGAGKPVEPGQIGEVVLTNLNRYAMPIIRYKNGDLASLSAEVCPCGCRLPMIAEIVGRAGEDITLPNGKMIPWNQLKGPMNHPNIRQFQIVQNANGSLTIKYVKEPQEECQKLESLLKPRFEAILGGHLPISFDEVCNIPQATSGKSKLVVSHYDRTLLRQHYRAMTGGADNHILE